jgi:hypothetical protein
MNLEAQGGSAEVSESEVSPSGNGIGTSAIQEPYTPAIERSGSSVSGNGKATGPRTRRGKQRASRNATKHGVFSRVAILDSESKAEYEELLAGLREKLQPEGALEELLVEKIGILAWRQRRLLLAESAEIRKNTEFVESDQRDRDYEAAGMFWNMVGFLRVRGLIGNTHNRYVLERCLEWLGDLRKRIEKVGFRPSEDAPILRMLYGDREVIRLRNDLYDSYETWLRIAEAPEQERERKRYPSPSEARLLVMEEIDKEIRRIKRDQKVRSSAQAARTQLEIQSRNVPDGPGLDRLLRYETSLERSFDRTLSQLERLQRIRLGQPVPPKLEVHHSMF